MELLIEAIYNMTESSAGKWAKKIFPWFATILLVVLVANLVKLLPGFETIGLMHHATKDGHALQQLTSGIATSHARKKGRRLCADPLPARRFH